MSFDVGDMYMCIPEVAFLEWVRSSEPAKLSWPRCAEPLGEFDLHQQTRYCLPSAAHRTLWGLDSDTLSQEKEGKTFGGGKKKFESKQD